MHVGGHCLVDLHGRAGAVQVSRQGLELDAPQAEQGAGGTRFPYEHTGFTGIGGFLLAKLVMTPVRRKMLGAGLAAVLNDVDDDGTLRPASTLKPKSQG